jgi:GNAT superfamily N-acetyltransferase
VLSGPQPDAVLVEAAAANQTEWFVRTAEAARGLVRRQEGVTWTSAPGGAVFAFPRLSEDQLARLLPRFLDDAAGVRGASCWSLLPTEPPGLGEALRSAGFGDGWQAHWMARELDTPFAAETPPGVRVAVVDEEWRATELPYDSAGASEMRPRLAVVAPGRVWHVGAWRHDEAVGHAVVSVSTGLLGVAGIYDMGVAAHERRRGIGRAILATVLELGREVACSYATLNATADGEALYRTVGFRSVGVAQTWWR